MTELDLMEPEVSIPVKISKHEIRTRETRELLLRAARTIFVRDGYEGAELGEIAELANRTKGAIYGHFESKEDIFLALIESNRNEYRKKMQALMEASSSVEGNVAALRKFFLDRSGDEDWALLLLEFKLFTIRHPEARTRLQKFYSENDSQEARYEKLLGKAGKSKRSISRTLAVHSITPMLSALLLESKVDPSLIAPADVKKLIERVFDMLLETT